MEFQNIELVKELKIHNSCAESYPCRHSGVLTLSDGRKLSVHLWGDEAALLLQVSSLKEKIVNQCSGDHFGGYIAHDASFEGGLRVLNEKVDELVGSMIQHGRLLAEDGKRYSEKG